MGTAFAIPGVWEIMDHAIGIIKKRGGSVSLDPNLRKDCSDSGRRSNASPGWSMSPTSSCPPATNCAWQLELTANCRGRRALCPWRHGDCS